MAMGSPGTTRSSTKTIDKVRKDHAVRLRHDLQSLLVDDRLHILEKRDHLALLGDIFVDRLVAGDALGLVLLAPQRSDALDEILALPGAMRRRAEHRKAGRGRRIADRIAPIVEGGRRQRVARAQFEMFCDLVDLDGGVDADLAPHADDRLDHLVVLRLEAARGLDRELDRLLRRVAALREQALRKRRIVGDLDRGIEGGIARCFQRRYRNAVTLQKAFDDRFLVYGVVRREAYIAIEHRVDIGEEDHGDVGHRFCLADQPRLALQTVEFLVGDFEGEVRSAGFHFGDAAGGIGDELEHHRVEGGLAAPIAGMRLQAQERVALEGVDLVRA